MLTRQRISLLLAVTFVASLVAVITTTLSRGQTTVSANQKIRVLRRKDQLKIRPLPGELVAFQEGQRERTLKNREFKDIPLAIAQVKNLKSDTWYKDLEIEVKNISSKRIYFILAYLQFPDVPEPGDAVFGIALHYGERRNIDYTKDADPKDPHLNPGDRFTFTIPEKMKEGLRGQHETTPELMKKLELHISVVSFGDGTGFVAERLLERKRSHSDVKKNHHSGRPGKSASMEPPPQDGCGSCSRYIMEDQPTVICYYASGDECPSDLATTRPDQPCTRVREVPFPCGREVRCHNDQIYPSEYCPGYTATPTPSPTPSPSPTPCIPGVCWDSDPTAVQVDNCNSDYVGGCPSGYTQSDNCCYPPCPAPTATRPSCPGGFLIPPSRLTFCNWICIPAATPNPNLEPGGGRGSQNREDNSCTEYYWVYYENWGSGWFEVWREYAGCW